VSKLKSKLAEIRYQDIDKPLIGVCVLLTIIVLVASYLSLEFYPAVFIDEPWYSDAAWSVVKGEGLFDTMNQGILDRSQQLASRWPLLGTMPYVISFKALGLSLFTGRQASWWIGIGVLGCVFLLAYQFYRPATAALAGLLLAISWPFLQASHYIRPDISLALVVTLALFFYLTGLVNHKRWAFLISGLLIGLSLDIHPNGIVFAFSLAVLHLILFRKAVFKSPDTWLFVGGALLAALYYFGFRYEFDIGAALSLSPVESKILPPPIASLDLATILRAIYWEFGRLNAYVHALDFVLIGAALFFMIGRRNRIDRFLLGYLSLVFILMALLTANKNQIYTILYYPLLTIFIAESFVTVLREKKILSTEGLFLGGMLCCSLAVFAISFARPVSEARGYSYEQTSQAIDSVIPEGAKVLGMPNWWLGLQDVQYRSILGVTYLHFLDGKSLTEALDSMQPEYIILDPAIRGRLVDQGYFSPGSFNAYLWPRQEFQDYLQTKGEVILEYDAPIDGLIEVIRMHNAQ
jgi:hypothetical protein